MSSFSFTPNQQFLFTPEQQYLVTGDAVGGLTLQRASNHSAISSSVEQEPVNPSKDSAHATHITNITATADRQRSMSCDTFDTAISTPDDAELHSDSIESQPISDSAESQPVPDNSEIQLTAESSESRPAPDMAEHQPILDEAKSQLIPDGAESQLVLDDTKPQQIPDEAESQPALDDAKSQPIPDDAESQPALDDAESQDANLLLRTDAQEDELFSHLEFLSSQRKSDRAAVRLEEFKTAPILSGEVSTAFSDLFDQFGLLAEHEKSIDDDDPRLMLNVSPPWSAFICGSQGSGKSHTLSCMLENCLLQGSQVSNVTKPLAGMVFHWDRFTSYGSNQICEAAYLCSAGIPVKVLVSPTNLERMRLAYGNLPNLKAGARQPVVVPMLLSQEQLDMPKMITLMGLRGKDKDMPLYMDIVFTVLREMVKEDQRSSRAKAKGFDYAAFIQKLHTEKSFNGGQVSGLNLRLDLLNSFMRFTGEAKGVKYLQTLGKKDEKNLRQAWSFEPGGLTIVDLSCPFVDGNAACSLFAVCLQLFLDNRGDDSRIIALDEAHKFLTGSSGAVAFTEELLQVIRQQRHLASRVVIATQEPTLSPKLLELCTVTIVHRFTSPQWFKFMQSHLAGLSTEYSLEDSDEDSSEDGDDDSSARNQKRAMAKLFREIVRLETGEGLLFCPTALMDVVGVVEGRASNARRLGTSHLKIRTRKRLTVDGGQSIMAK